MWLHMRTALPHPQGDAGRWTPPRTNRRYQRPHHSLLTLLSLNLHCLNFFFFFKILFIYHETHTERGETQAEGEVGSMQGAQRGPPSQVSRIRPCAAGGTKPPGPRGCPTCSLVIVTSTEGISFTPLSLLNKSSL